jgi:3-oxoacyl-(acyl-carrier-protein) synthase
LEAAVRAALGQAGIDASDVAFINAHGTATQDNDRAEGKVIARMFGSKIPFLSTKGFTGHTLGAAGGLEAAFTLLALRDAWIPGSAGFINPSEDVPVAPVRRNTEISGSYALSTSLAFGGNNAAVLIGRRA